MTRPDTLSVIRTRPVYFNRKALPMMMRKCLASLSVAIALVFSSATVLRAQTEPLSIPMWNTIGQLNQTTLNQSLFGTDYIPDADDGDIGDTRITLADRPTAPAQLASVYEPADRPRAQALFEDLLTTYGQLADQLGISENDLAGAVAAFVAGSWMAYHDRDVTDEDFPVLVRQMRAILRETPEINQASLREKQELYENLAILGTLMAATRLALQQQPDQATTETMRAAAGSYLQGFTGIDPDDMIIDEAGLHVR